MPMTIASVSALSPDPCNNGWRSSQVDTAASTTTRNKPPYKAGLRHKGVGALLAE
jgi:hypothetical protein